MTNERTELFWNKLDMILKQFSLPLNPVSSQNLFQALRKASDQRHMESEDAAEGERKEAEMKVESLTSIVKMFELKAKNSQEQSEYNAVVLLLLYFPSVS